MQFGHFLAGRPVPDCIPRIGLKNEATVMERVFNGIKVRKGVYRRSAIAFLSLQYDTDIIDVCIFRLALI